MPRELLFTIVNGKPQPAASRTLEQVGLKERQDLEAWVISYPDILGPGIAVVTSEFSGWTTPQGVASHDRLDVLGLDREGRLVVVELKRGKAPTTIEMQVLNYAARASLFRLDALVAVHREFLRKRGEPTVTLDEARERLSRHAGDLSDESLSAKPRVVLVAEEFGKDVTTTAFFLRRALGLEIDLIRLESYETATSDLVVSVSRVFPPPDIGDDILYPTSPEQEQETILEKTREKNTVARILDAQAIPEGTVLYLKPGSEITKVAGEKLTAWVSEDSQRGTATWKAQSGAPLVWAYDGKPYSPTGLVKHIASLAGVEIMVVAGPRSWQDGKGRTLPEIADDAEKS